MQAPMPLPAPLNHNSPCLPACLQCGFTPLSGSADPVPEPFSTAAACSLANSAKLSLVVTAQCEVRQAGRQAGWRWMLERQQETWVFEHCIDASLPLVCPSDANRSL